MQQSEINKDNAWSQEATFQICLMAVTKRGPVAEGEWEEKIWVKEDSVRSLLPSWPYPMFWSTRKPVDQVSDCPKQLNVLNLWFKHMEIHQLWIHSDLNIKDVSAEQLEAQLAGTLLFINVARREGGNRESQADETNLRG